jgi:benzoyl-CoA reductase/2-hydroxyglutaryl-CoA dehydratase subunit BcrC/BadD/HgdB
MIHIYESAVELLSEYEEYLHKQKSLGKKLIGYFAHEFLPPEIIQAVGAIPVPLILAGDESRTTAGADYLTPTMCPFALSQIGSYLQRENPGQFKFLNLLDAVIATNYCAADTLVNEWISDLGKLRFYRLHIPYLRDSYHIDYYRHELEQLIKKMEELTGRSLSVNLLYQQIQQSRALHSILMQIAKSTLPGSTKNKIFQQSILNGIEWLPNFDLKALQSYAKSLTNWQKAKSSEKSIILAGSPVFIGDALYSFIEECGGNAVVDLTWLGFTYWAQDTDLTLIETSNPPLSSLLTYLTDRFTQAPAPLHCAPNTIENYASLINNVAQQLEIKGVIYHIIKFCDLVGHHRQALKDSLTQQGLNVLLLERDYSANISGQIRTRIEAFFEMIQ